MEKSHRTTTVPATPPNPRTCPAQEKGRREVDRYRLHRREDCPRRKVNKNVAGREQNAGSQTGVVEKTHPAATTSGQTRNAAALPTRREGRDLRDLEKDRETGRAGPFSLSLSSLSDSFFLFLRTLESVLFSDALSLSFSFVTSLCLSSRLFVAFWS